MQKNHPRFRVEVAAAEKREGRQSFWVRDHKGIHRFLVWAEEEDLVLRSTSQSCTRPPKHPESSGEHGGSLTPTTKLG